MTVEEQENLDNSVRYGWVVKNEWGHLVYVESKKRT